MNENRKSEKEEKDRKLIVLTNLSSIYRCNFTEDAIELMVRSIEKYSANSIEKASEIHLRNVEYFSIKSLTDVIQEFDLNAEEKIVDEVSPERAVEVKKMLEELDKDESVVYHNG